MVVWIGLAAGLIVCVWGSSRGSLTVGDTVLFITMMQQLYVPLTYFGSYYRQVGACLYGDRALLLQQYSNACLDGPYAPHIRKQRSRWFTRVQHTHCQVHRLS